MKKIKILSLGLLSLMASTALADDCCRSICDIFCGDGWSYQTRIGVYPTIWRDRPDIFFNSCGSVPSAPVNLGELPKFSRFFKLPWIVGTQLQYAWSDCLVVYGELNYIQAGRKKREINTALATDPAFALRLDTYRAISGYIGLMYNFASGCFCDNVSFFIGGKIGFIYRENILARQFALAPVQAPSCACPSPFKRDLFRHGAKLSGGGNIGLLYCWCPRWSIVLTGEVVVSGGPKGNACIPLTTPEIGQLGNGTLLIGKIKTEISFPITLGLKYDF